ncbi:nuclear pore complex protein Nup133 [Klebsormidium nitens]|uniref:Nuclear pore complex protein Nup133 n=1 Tax=Klebsormidium nitens TaxID=105231 RepID=A0A1Y1IN79_KLENI|nr:nuclear pore complex protein Nup133 [Klebsormidium nitens]|eukprot:GAQ89578.1 nuclear pore complex protein Nup133 [Klebsormidium nitens]
MFSTGKKPKTPGRGTPGTRGARSSSRLRDAELALPENLHNGLQTQAPPSTVRQETPLQHPPGHPYENRSHPATDVSLKEKSAAAQPNALLWPPDQGHAMLSERAAPPRKEDKAEEVRIDIVGDPAKSDENMAEERPFSSGREEAQEQPAEGDEGPDSKAQVKVLKHYIDFTLTGVLDGVVDGLRHAGAFDESGRRNGFARASRSFVDALGKSWTNESANASLVIRGYLADKQRRHARFLEFVSRLGVVDELRSTSALTAILEHSEKIASAVALREFQNAASDFAQQSAPGPFTPSETDPGQATLTVVRAAGERGLRRHVALSGRDSVEVFYTRVSSLEDFFSSLTSHAAAACFADVSQAPLRLQAERVCELMDAAGRVVEAARKTRDAHASSFESIPGLPWTASPPVLDGLWTLCRLASDVQTRAASSNPSLVPLINQRLRSLGEMLLDGHRESLEATLQAGGRADVIGARKEYAARRDVLLRAQLHFVRGAATAVPGGDQSGPGSEVERARATTREYAYLAAVAKKHGCFEVLADICEDRGDDARLLDYMKADPPAASEGRFSLFVFERCLAQREESRLLRFGDQGFGRELGRFLEGRPRLRWLHEIGQQEFSDAADTLASISGTEELPSVSEAQLRLQLCVEKLARLAAPRTAKTEALLDTLDRRIGLIDLQVEHGVSSGRPLPPAQLIEELLKGDRGVVPAAFEAFSLAGPSFVAENRALVERAWLKAASLDDWLAFQKAYVSEGWSDAMYLEELQKTVLCSAAANLYARDGSYSMTEVMPLRSGDGNQQWSVQAMLSKHASFAAAAEVMLDAVAFGSGSEGGGLEGGSSTMLLD